MKRILSLLLALLLVLGLTACMPAPQSSEQPIGISVIPADSTDTAGKTPADLTAPETEPAATPESDIPETDPATPEANTPETQAPVPEAPGPTVSEDGVYDSKEEVALYIHLYRHLPSNYITKKQAEALGWPGGDLRPYAPGKCIGGSHFGNYEGLLPKAQGREWTECDIDTLGKKSRGPKRIIFSNDGLIYYTDDHYESFTQLYDGWED